MCHGKPGWCDSTEWAEDIARQTLLMALPSQIFLYLSVLTSASGKKMWYAKCQISEKVGTIQTTGGSVFYQGAEDGGTSWPLLTC